jgi:hypothetical protein
MREWVPRFLDALASSPNVSAAARLAGIDRKTAYNWREQSSEFAEAWDDAIETSTDYLEAEARRRAFEGCDEPVFYQGEECGAIRKYSDTLMIVLLKAHRPEKYRERSQVEHVGSVPVRYVNDWRATQTSPESTDDPPSDQP